MTEKMSGYRANKKLIGQILIKRGLLKPEQLTQALLLQRSRGGTLGKILVQEGFLKELDVIAALVIQWAVPYIAIEKYPPNPSVLAMIPSDFAHARRVIPLDRVGEVLSVVMEDPLDEQTRQDLKNICHVKVAPFIATPSAIALALNRWYPPREI